MGPNIRYLKAALGSSVYFRRYFKACYSSGILLQVGGFPVLH